MCTCSGKVIAAQDSRIDRVAIKFVPTGNPEEVQREVALLQRVSHEHICTFHELRVLEGGLHAIVIEALNK